MENSRFEWPEIGQQKIINFLEHSIVNDKVFHSYLVIGPEYSYKKILVNSFVNNLLCHESNSSGKDKIPCQKCVACDQFKKGIHPDVFLVKKSEEKNEITIEQIRELKQKLSLKGFFDSYKIAIIHDADLINKSAANALLKVLEEPLGKTAIFLLVKNEDVVLPTIKSRCIRLKFLPVSEGELMESVKEEHLGPQKTKEIARLSLGRPRLMKKLLEQEHYENFVEEIKVVFEIIKQEPEVSIKTMESKIRSFDKDKKQIKFFLEKWEIIFRDILLILKGRSNLITNLFIKDELEILAEKYTDKKVIELLNEIKEYKNYLKFNINLTLLFNNLILKTKL